MFGIDKIKEAVQSLRLAEIANVEAIKSLQSHVAHIKSDVLKLSGQFGEFKDNIKPVTAHRADELAVAISKCSLDMAELDRRLCALENAQTFTMGHDKHYESMVANGAIQPLSERDKAFSPNAVLVPKAAQQPLPLGRKKRQYTRETADITTRRIIAADNDARNIASMAQNMYDVPQRVIDACIAAGAVEALRIGETMAVNLKYRRTNKAPFNASIRRQGHDSRDIGFYSKVEAENCMNQMQRFLSAGRTFFSYDKTGKGK